MRYRLAIRLFKDVLIYGFICAIISFFSYTIIVIKMKQVVGLWYMVFILQILLANIGCILDVLYFKFWPRSDWVLEQKEQGVTMEILLQNFIWIGLSTVAGSVLGAFAARLLRGYF